MPCSCPLVHRISENLPNRGPRDQEKRSLHHSGSLQHHLPDPVRPTSPCLPRLHRQRHYRLRMTLRNFGHPASPQGLPSSHRPSDKSFWKGGVRGGRTFFPKRFPSPQAFPVFTSSGVCLPSPNKKIPGGAGTKKDPLALRAARGSRTIFGSGLLSHMTLCSIIGDGELNFRVRNGVGCTLSSMATKEIW